MYVILRILKHMALVDFVTLPTYSLEQCALWYLSLKGHVQFLNSALRVSVGVIKNLMGLEVLSLSHPN